MLSVSDIEREGGVEDAGFCGAVGVKIGHCCDGEEGDNVNDFAPTCAGYEDDFWEGGGVLRGGDVGVEGGDFEGHCGLTGGIGVVLRQFRWAVRC